MRLVFVTDYDARDVRQFSGIPFHMVRAFEAHGVEVECVTLSASLGLRALGAPRKAYHKLRRETFIARRAPLRRRVYGRQLRRALSRGPYDVVFAPEPLGLSVLPPGQVGVLWTDATAAGLIRFLPQFSSLAPATVRHSHAIERAALKRASLVAYSSEWAAATAREAYGVNEERLAVVEFGANIDQGLDRRGLDEALLARRGSPTCRLLFNGVNWWIKNGDKAVETARRLRAAGVDCELTILGIPADAVPVRANWIRLEGFVDKRTSSGRLRFREIHERSHFLLLPSRVEAYGIALAEANAFALPVVASSVGGIPTVVRDGSNGKLFDVDAPAADLARYIASVFRDGPEYERLARSAYREYCERLNWATATTRVLALLEALLRNR